MNRDNNKNISDERKVIVGQILKDFGVSIPLLTWSGMTKAELIVFYNEYAQAIGEPLYDDT